MRSNILYFSIFCVYHCLSPDSNAPTQIGSIEIFSEMPLTTAMIFGPRTGATCLAKLPDLLMKSCDLRVGRGGSTAGVIATMASMFPEVAGGKWDESDLNELGPRVGLRGLSDFSPMKCGDYKPSIDADSPYVFEAAKAFRLAEAVAEFVYKGGKGLALFSASEDILRALIVALGGKDLVSQGTETDASTAQPLSLQLTIDIFESSDKTTSILTSLNNSAFPFCRGCGVEAFLSSLDGRISEPYFRHCPARSHKGSAKKQRLKWGFILLAGVLFLALLAKRIPLIWNNNLKKTQ